MRRKVWTILLSTLALLGGYVVVAAPASAAVGCWGDYCSGRDPMSTGCANDAITTATANFSTGSVQVRWSPTCKTNWTRLVVYPTGRSCMNYGSLWAVQDTGYRQSTEVPFVCNTYSTTTYWTPMIYSPVHRVRGEFYNLDRSYDSVITAWS